MKSSKKIQEQEVKNQFANINLKNKEIVAQVVTYEKLGIIEQQNQWSLVS